jgi:hypothetical protein
VLARPLLALSSLAVAAGLLACGGVTSNNAGDAGRDVLLAIDAPGPDHPQGDDSGAPVDAGSDAFDAGGPVDANKTACPSTYSVYGDTDASDNLGHVNPTLYASGTCSGPLEQYEDVDGGPDGGSGDRATDLQVTLTQSAPRSGMFVTVIHQTTPFAFDFTTCLESAGHGTGSMPGPDMPGTAAMVNDPEIESFPQVQLDTNFAGNDLVFDVALSLKAQFTLNSVSCTFTKN